MFRFSFSVGLLCLYSTAVSQTASSDKALLGRTRALYDAPFTRDLVSFDCAVQFDWKEHFVAALGTMLSAAVSTANRLQTISRRVFVNHLGVVVSAMPKAPDLSGYSHAADLEQALDAMISGGLNAWLPFSTNVILPVGPTQFTFQKMEPGYKLKKNGHDVEATLLLGEDLRVTSVVSQLPQPIRLTTDFVRGPDGFLLGSVKTESTTDAAKAGEATFAFTYQNVQGFQIPSLVIVTPATAEVWRYTLTDCKAMKGIQLNVGPSSLDPIPIPSPAPDSIVVQR